MFNSLKRYYSAISSSGRAKIGLSVFFVLVAVFDTFAKPLSMTAVIALSLAIVPWAVNFIEKLTLPGGIELVFKHVERKLDAVPVEPDQKDLDAFKFMSMNDPNMAIAMLRIQIERRLREIAEQVMLESPQRGRPRTLRGLAEALAERGAISPDAPPLIGDLMPVMSEAVHGLNLNSDASSFALEYGPRILAMLRPQGTPVGN